MSGPAIPRSSAIAAQRQGPEDLRLAALDAAARSASPAAAAAAAEQRRGHEREHLVGQRVGVDALADELGVSMKPEVGDARAGPVLGELDAQQAARAARRPPWPSRTARRRAR
jgi:hypothetical protein